VLTQHACPARPAPILCENRLGFPMESDTGIGGDHSRFPETRRSAIADLGSPDIGSRECALETLMAAYWKPIYKYIRFRWNRSNEDAKDLTQEFLAQALEKEFFRGYDPTKARFRTYLRVCLDRFLGNANKAATRIKRGGDRTVVPVHCDDANKEARPREIASTLPTPEEYFHREWVRNLFTLSADDLKRECEERDQRMHYEVFERYDLNDGAERLSYNDLAAELGITATTVTNYLAAMRRRFRNRILERIRETTGSEREFRDEVRAALGVEV
jgi:RNA polymerase sigma factor (sigma-70 family)